MKILLVFVFALSGKWQVFTDSDVINAIRWHNDALYLATSGGVVAFDPQSKSIERKYTTVDGLPSAAVRDIEFDAMGGLWAVAFGERRGLAFKAPDSDEFELYPPAYFPALTSPVDIAICGDTVLIASEAGLLCIDTRGTYELEDDRQFRFSTAQGFPFDSDTFVSVTIWMDTVFAATEHGLWRAPIGQMRDPTSWESVVIPPFDLTSRTITRVYRRNDIFAVGSDEGFWCKIADFEGVFLNEGSDLAYIKDFWSKEDTLFVAALRVSWSNASGGIYKIGPNGAVERLDWGAGNDEGYNWGRFATAVGGHDTLLAAGFGWTLASYSPDYQRYGAGLAIYDHADTCWHLFRLGELASNLVSFVLTKDGIVWVGHRMGSKYPFLFEGFRDGQWIYTDPPYRIRGPFAYAVDHQGNLWVGTYASPSQPDSLIGIFKFDTLGRFVEHYSVSSPHIIDMAVGLENEVYFTIGDVGTFVLKDSVIERVECENPNPIVMEVDNLGRLWLSSLGNGCEVFDPKTGVSFWLKESNGLPSNEITVFKPDGDDMWIGTMGGLAFFDGSSISNSYLEGEVIKGVDVTPDGRVWVLTADALVVLRPENGLVEARMVNEYMPLPGSQDDPSVVEGLAVSRSDGTVWIATNHGLAAFKPDVLGGTLQTERPFVYPNPYERTSSLEFVTVVGVPFDSEIKVITISGEQVDVDVQIRGNSAFIRAADLPPGLYFVRVKSSKINKVLKLAVK
ncbi:MAG: hypothetical protein DRQ10_02590 [Candidatus Hydrothermota bacterium]|nr:MAG: hypothetical protein DRQ10_02590 [Candidatus Hydrothermae bacterium]